MTASICFSRESLPTNIWLSFLLGRVRSCSFHKTQTVFSSIYEACGILSLFRSQKTLCTIRFCICLGLQKKRALLTFGTYSFIYSSRKMSWYCCFLVRTMFYVQSNNFLSPLISWNVDRFTSSHFFFFSRRITYLHLQQV